MSAENQSQKTITVAIDAMGGDQGPETAVAGVALIAKERSDLRFLVFGDQSQIEHAINRHSILQGRCRVVHTETVVNNDDKPSVALRASKGTSMRMAIEAVQNKEAQAVVSAGNTGSLMAMAKMILKTLPGIHRPAIASLMPTEKDNLVMLDLGANVLVDAENLAQFAVLGAVFSKAHKKINTPTVGLLNVGTEENKGPEHVRSAARILSQVEFPGRYYGFVEGTDIPKGTVDVVVCDGYAGNIALKTAEGFGSFSKHFVKQAFLSGPLAMIGGMFAYFALKRLKKKIDPRFYNGGVFLGLNGLCIKSHGGTDALGFSSAVRLAIKLADHGYTARVSEEINHLMSQDSFLAQGAYQG